MARFPVFTKRLAELAGDNVTQFAKKTGLSRPTASFYRNGDRIPDAATLAQICRRCDVSADWLIGLSEEKRPDVDSQAVTRKIGLSSESISRLQLMQQIGETQMLNAIFSDKRLSEIIWFILKAKDEQNTEDPEDDFMDLLVQLEEKGFIHKMNRAQAAELCIEGAVSVFRDIVRGIVQNEKR